MYSYWVIISSEACKCPCLPRWLSPKPKGNQRAYESFSSCSFFSMMVWTMVEVTSPLQDPTAIIPHANAVTPTTCRLHTSSLATFARVFFRVRPVLKRKHSSIPPCWIWSLPWQGEAEKGHLLCWSQRRPGPVWKCHTTRITNTSSVK